MRSGSRCARGGAHKPDREPELRAPSSSASQLIDALRFACERRHQGVALGVEPEGAEAVTQVEPVKSFNSLLAGNGSYV